MAVTGADLHIRQPSAWTFVRLKLRIMRNGFRSRNRLTQYIIGVVLMAFMVVGGVAALVAASTNSRSEVRWAAVGLVTSALVIGWVLFPLLFFGVDETVDPARFALLPVSRGTVAKGMLLAAFFGIPPLATLLVLSATLAGAALRGGVAATLFTLVCVLVTLVVCILASRAVTSAFASMLRSRKMRDLAAIVLAVFGASCGPLQLVITHSVQGSGVDRISALAHWLAWTPIGAPMGAALDGIDGNWGNAAARLGIAMLTIVLLGLWWSSTLEEAILGNVSSGVKRHDMAGQTPLGNLFPKALRWMPLNPFGAIVVKECRYYVREPRRRAGLASLVISSAVIPVMMRVSAIQQSGSTANALPLPFVVLFTGSVMGIVLANQFGTDGPAYGAHLLIGVRGRVELMARMSALGLIAVPVSILGTTAAAAMTKALGDLPAAIGMVLASFGVQLGIATLLSIFIPYPMPDSKNPFAMNQGSGSAKGLYSMLGLIGGMAACAPLIAIYQLLPNGLRSIMLVIGAVYGATAALVMTYIAGDVLDRRAPEVLAAVTPGK